MDEQNDVVSPFCQGCTLKCTNGGRGCVAWQKWYIDWWNRNIYNPPDSPEEGAENESSDSL